MTTATTPISRPFRPTVGLSRWIVVFLTALIIGGLIVLLTYFNFTGSVNRFLKDPPKTFIEATMARSEIMGRARTFDGLYQLFNFLSIPTGVLINILLMIWIYRSVSNLVAFNVQGLRFTPGWAVGWFFIPFANLIMPPIVMTEIWKASKPGGQADNLDWKHTPMSTLIPIWWLCLLGVGFSPLILLFIPLPSQEQLAEGDFSLMTIRLLIVIALQIIWAVSLITLVRKITSRQVDKHSYISYISIENRPRTLTMPERPSLPMNEPVSSGGAVETNSLPLTELEQKTLIMISERRTNSEMSRVLAVSPAQVEDLIDALYNKFDVNNDIDLIWKARELGYLPE